MDLGAGRRGVDMGPSALRIARLRDRLTELGYEVEDLGNVVVDQPESSPSGAPNARYLPQIAHTCARMAYMVEGAMERGRAPVVALRESDRRDQVDPETDRGERVGIGVRLHELADMHVPPPGEECGDRLGGGPARLAHPGKGLSLRGRENLLALCADGA